MPSALNVRGIDVPPFMYGTAWKESATEQLTKSALGAGFRAIDTANQRRHYFEAGVGEALAAAIGENLVSRDDVFLQTKFTYARGQDHRLPYDPNADYPTQVQQSFQSSLEHLRVSTIDSFVLHGPAAGRGLTDADRQVWGAMEELARAGKVKLLGVSNVSLEQLRIFTELSTVPLGFVQNRCFARVGWDRAVREFCNSNSIVYQGFSLLTANERELMTPAVGRIAEKYGCSIAQLVFAFARAVGMLPLTGTSREQHMKEDLQALELELDERDVAAIERIGG